MANCKKPINEYFLSYLASVMTARLKEKGITFYAFWKYNGFSPDSCKRVFKGRASCNIGSLVQYLDALDLEIKIVPKKNNANETGD